MAGYDLVLGRIGPEGAFIFAEDTSIAARIDDNGVVRVPIERLSGFTAQELKLLAHLVEAEGKARAGDNELRGTGVCPTFMRDLGQGEPADETLCFVLAERLRDLAKKLQGGPYR